MVRSGRAPRRKFRVGASAGLFGRRSSHRSRVSNQLGAGGADGTAGGGNHRTGSLQRASAAGGRAPSDANFAGGGRSVSNTGDPGGASALRKDAAPTRRPRPRSPRSSPSPVHVPFQPGTELPVLRGCCRCPGSALYLQTDQRQPGAALTGVWAARCAPVPGAAAQRGERGTRGGANAALLPPAAAPAPAPSFPGAPLPGGEPPPYISHRGRTGPAGRTGTGAGGVARRTALGTRRSSLAVAPACIRPLPAPPPGHLRRSSQERESPRPSCERQTGARRGARALVPFPGGLWGPPHPLQRLPRSPRRGLTTFGLRPPRPPLVSKQATTMAALGDENATPPWATDVEVPNLPGYLSRPVTVRSRSSSSSCSPA